MPPFALTLFGRQRKDWKFLLSVAIFLSKCLLELACRATQGSIVYSNVESY